MKWSREKDYHGYKSYAEDPAAGTAAGGILGGIIGALKAALNFVARPTPPAVTLKKAGRSGYSTLGGGSGLHRPPECPFPTEPANANPARHR
jgi:hypothetical protein